MYDFQMLRATHTCARPLAVLDVRRLSHRSPDSARSSRCKPSQNRCVLQHTSSFAIHYNRQPRRLVRQRAPLRIQASDLYVAGPAENELVLVAGASGGVGQLVTAKLIERGYRVRALVRSEQKAKEVFGDKLAKGLQISAGDCRDSTFVKSVTSGVDIIICCLGTTAFPSLRWQGGNPEEADRATSVLIDNAPEGLLRFVLVTSAGVERADKLPFNILNAFGALKWKKAAEDRLKASGLPYTIVRPGRLMDGPFTSYDLNTLLQSTSGLRREVQLSAQDDQMEEASRISVAEAIVQSLKIDTTINKTFSISSKEGDGPGQDPKKWRQLLDAIS